MSIYTYRLTPNFGAAKTGQAANIVAKVYDSTNTLQATVNTSWAEQTDAAGNAVTGAYRNTVTLDTTWLPVEIRYTITGQAGVWAGEVVGADYVQGNLGNVTVGAYAAGQDPASLLLTTPSNKLTTSAAGYVRILDGTIDLTTLTPLLKTVLLGQYFATAATTIPATADTWSVSGIFNNQLTFVGQATAKCYWFNGTTWTLSGGVGVNGPGYWNSATASPWSALTAHGTASGAPVIAAHGTAALEQYQPDNPTVAATLSGSDSTAQNVIAIKAVTDELGIMIVGNAFTAAALLNAPTGQIFFTPILGSLTAVQPVMANFSVTQFSARSFSWAAVDVAGNPVSLAGKTIEFVASTNRGLKVITYNTSTTPGNISVNGTGNNIIIVTFAPADTLNAQNLLYTIWDITGTPNDLDLFNGALAINGAVQP